MNAIKKLLSVGLSAILLCAAPGAGVREAVAGQIVSASSVKSAPTVSLVSIQGFSSALAGQRVAMAGLTAPLAAASRIALQAAPSITASPNAIQALTDPTAQQSALAASPAAELAAKAPAHLSISPEGSSVGSDLARIAQDRNLPRYADGGQGAMGAGADAASVRGGWWGLPVQALSRSARRSSAPRAVKGLRTGASRGIIVPSAFRALPGFVKGALMALGFGALLAAAGCGGGSPNNTNLTSTGNPPQVTPTPLPPPTRTPGQLAANITLAANNPATPTLAESAQGAAMSIGANGDVVIHVGPYSQDTVYQYMLMNMVQGNLSYYVVSGDAVVQQANGAYSVDPTTVMNHVLSKNTAKDGDPYIQPPANVSDVWVDVAADGNGGVVQPTVFAPYGPLNQALYNIDAAKAPVAGNFQNSPDQTFNGQVGPIQWNADGSVASANPGDFANVLSVTYSGAMQFAMNSLGTGWVQTTAFDPYQNLIGLTRNNGFYVNGGSDYTLITHDADARDTANNAQIQTSYTAQLTDMEPFSGYVQDPGDWISQNVYVGAPAGDLSIFIDVPFYVNMRVEVYGPGGYLFYTDYTGYGANYSVTVPNAGAGVWTVVASVWDNQNYTTDSNGFIYYYPESVSGTLSSDNTNYILQKPDRGNSSPYRDPLSALANSTVSRLLGLPDKTQRAPTPRQLHGLYPEVPNVGKDNVPVAPRKAPNAARTGKKSDSKPIPTPQSSSPAK